MKKTRSSTKIAIAFALLAAAAYFGYGFVSGWLINRKEFAAIPPGDINIVGVDTSAGYYIIVANQVAQLVRGEAGQFEAAAPEEIATAEKKRVPIRELLQSLQGDKNALGKFTMAMNDMSDAEFPPYPVVWKAEDIVKAVESDAALRKKLEQDLNVRLDGTPLEQIRISALEEGIILDSPVEIEVQVGSERKAITGRVQEQFVPRFCESVWTALSEKSNLTNAVIAGYYREEARKLLEEPNRKENVANTLKGRIDPNRLASLGRMPKRMLDSAKIIVNDGLIESASYEEKRTSDGKPMFDLVLNLTDEGRQRLWQYSKRNPRAQLLVTWEGIAIAAPRIQGELPLSRVTVSQLFDEGLVRDTVNAINQKNKENR
jgi:hypothetical protein